MILFLYNVCRLIFLGLMIWIYSLICNNDNIYGKIRNQYIKRGLPICGIFIAITFAFSLIGHGVPAKPDWIYLFLIHISIASIASFILWKMHLWPAGDSKLFIYSAIVLAILVPNAAYFPYTLFLSLLINILIPSACVFLAEAILAAMDRKKRNKESLLSIFDKNFFSEASGFMFTYICFAYIRESLRLALNVNSLIFFFLLLIIWPFLSKFFRKYKKITYLLTAGIIIFFIFSESAAQLGKAAMRGVLISLPFMTLRVLIKELMERDSIIEIEIRQLCPGTILTNKYHAMLQNEHPVFYKEVFSKNYPDGLTKEQYLKLREFILSNNNQEKLLPIQARKGTPFATGITAGLILTILLKGETVISLCKMIFQSIKELI